jgi:hypothetical protein
MVVVLLLDRSLAVLVEYHRHEVIPEDKMVFYVVHLLVEQELLPAAITAPAITVAKAMKTSIFSVLLFHILTEILGY